MPPQTQAGPTIVAIDFETANYDAHSACQLGLVRIENWMICQTASWLIRPPFEDFVFSDLHGITWSHVETSPDFGKLWQQIEPFLSGAHYLAAHNAPFDQKVLGATCAFHGLEAPRIAFIDTVAVARKTWKIFPTKLNNVCEYLNIPLNHHEALSDARACAEIIIKAQHQGWSPA